MNHNADEQTLRNAGVRVTVVRLMIWREIGRSFSGPFSLADLEDALPTVDKSTLFRTLTLLNEAHLLHDIDDGSGTHKYCICHHEDTRLCSGHVHFSCRICHRTWCISELRIPPVSLPEGFLPEEAEYLVKGICPDCRNREQ